MTVHMGALLAVRVTVRTHRDGHRARASESHARKEVGQSTPRPEAMPTELARGAVISVK